jgi:hypothetical protein
MNDATNHAEAHEVLRHEPRVFGDCLDLRRIVFQDRRGAFGCDNREVAVRGDPEVPRGGERQRSPEALSPMTSEATGTLRDAMVHKSSEMAILMLALLSFLFVSRSGGVYEREDRQPEPLVEVERTFGGAEPRRAGRRKR